MRPHPPDVEPTDGRNGAPAAASAWVARWLSATAPGARVLDFACGGGRHTRLAVRRGCTVFAVDRDRGALAGLTLEGDVPGGVFPVVADLEGQPWPFAPSSFDAVIVANYLFRPRLSLLCGLLRPAGQLIYETFARGNERYGRPSNPAYLLRAGELLDVARRAGLVVIAFEDGIVAAPKPARVQRICAVRPPVSYGHVPLG